MIVMHLINNFGDSSISTIVCKMVRHFEQQGYSLHVGALSGYGDMRGMFCRMGARVVDFSEGKGGSLAYIKKIREYVATHQVKLVHTHTPRTLLMAAAALSMKTNPVHVSTKHILNSPGDRRWGLLYAILDRILLYMPNHLIAVSGKVYRGIIACPAVSAGRVTMIRNAIDCEPFYASDQRDSCRSGLGLAPESIVIGSSGRLEKVKRYDLLLRGFASIHSRFPLARLMMIGDGSLKTDLERLAEDLGIADAVIWTGFRKDVPRLLAAMDIYIMPSVNEGLSLSILEAMAAGKPVIITDVGGARELVEDGRTGILIAPGSVSMIEAAILDLLEDPVKRSSLASAGRDYIEREFGIRQMLESYQHVYETLVSGI